MTDQWETITRSDESEPSLRLVREALPPVAGSLAEFVGFTATKGFRAARRALRPVEGDTFVTMRDGILIFSQIDCIGDGWIGLGRFRARSGEPLGFVKMAASDWSKAVIRGLRMGCEFRPANAPVELPAPDQKS